MIKIYFSSLMEIRNLRKIIGRLELSLGFSSWLLDDWLHHLHHVFLSILSLYVPPPLFLSLSFFLSLFGCTSIHIHLLINPTTNEWIVKHLPTYKTKFICATFFCYLRRFEWTFLWGLVSDKCELSEKSKI